MAEYVRHPPTHADIDHEKSDVNIRAIAGFGGGLIALAIVVYVVVWLLFGYLARREDRASVERTYPLAVGQEDRLPPEPRLQTNPRQDLKDLRDAEDQVLKSYQWVDRNAGVVRIPIDEAMKLTLRRGLPARQAHAQEVVK
jgi:hypothetical protein